MKDEGRHSADRVGGLVDPVGAVAADDGVHGAGSREAHLAPEATTMAPLPRGVLTENGPSGGRNARPTGFHNSCDDGNLQFGGIF